MSFQNQCNLLNCINSKVNHIEKYIKKGNIFVSHLTPCDESATIGSAGNSFNSIYTDEINVNNIVINTIEEGCITTTNSEGKVCTICPTKKVYPCDPFQLIIDANDQISISSYGTSIRRDNAEGASNTTHVLPDGVCEGQLKKINLYKTFITPGFNVTALITSNTFSPNSAFRLESPEPSQGYTNVFVLFKWTSGKWVPIDSIWGSFVL